MCLAALAWQQFVSEQLPWVQAEAGKEKPSSKGYEEVLDLLLSANGEINDVLRLYHGKAVCIFQCSLSFLIALFPYYTDNEQRIQRQRQEEKELQMVFERSKQEKTRPEAQAGNGDHLGYGLSQGMAPVASSSGSSSHASGSGSPDESSSQPRKVVMQTNNPYASASEPTPAVLPDRYIVDEPIDEAPPTAVASSVPIGDKNPFQAYMKQREESIDVPVPKEPSAKALGKLRRVSGQDGELLDGCH